MVSIPRESGVTSSKRTSFTSPLEYTALDGSAYSDHLIGVHPFGRLLSKERLDGILDGRNPGGSTHEDHLVDVTVVQSGSLHGRAAGLDGALDQRVRELLELGAAQGADQVLGHAVDRHDVGQVDLCAVGAAELDFGLFSPFLEALQCHGILTQVQSAILLLELCDEPVDDGLVKVVAAEVGVAIGGQHLEDAVSQFEDR